MAGAGYKLFNTGDVLTAAQVNTYLMEQTVMVFADAAARTTALTGVVSEGMLSYLKSTKQVEVYNGSAWVASDDPNAIQNTIVDAKGDLITATAADTPARLAVGSNGETLVADSAATTGLRWQGNYAAGKNKIINGDFGIWQRGTSFTSAAPQYTADRWYFSGATSNRTISRQAFTAGTAPVSGYESQYFLRYAVSSGTVTSDNLQQRIEDVRTFAGQTATISFWAKAGANLSLPVYYYQDFGSGGSSAVVTSIGTVSVTTSWQRFSLTVAIPSISGKTIGAGNFFTFFWSFDGLSAPTIDFWGIQAEAGNVATAFQTATGTLQGEIALAQRYYYRATMPVGNLHFGPGSAYSTTQAYAQIQFPVEMRIRPTAVEQTGTAADYRVFTNNFGAANCNGVPTFNSASNWSGVVTTTVASGLVAGDYAALGSTVSNAYLGWSAEL